MTATVATHRVAGARLEVVEAGEGPTLGYLHGIMGTPTGLAFVSALADQGWHVIAPNLPGFAGSEPLMCRNLYDWVGCLSEAVDACGLKGAPLVAASVGAMIAAELAAVRPEAFEQLILIGPLGLWLDDHPVHDLWSERTSRQPGFLVTDPTVLAPLANSNPDADPAALLDDELRRYRTRSAAASIMWPIPDRGLADRMHRVRCTTHVVWGADDRLANATAYTAAWLARLPHAGKNWIIEGAGHLAEWDAPDAVASAVTEALGRHATLRPGVTKP